MKVPVILYLQFITISSWAQVQYQALDSLFISHERNNNFGGAVLVAERDSVIFQKAMGWTDHDRNEKLKVNTPIPLASLTKSFTSTAIMILKQREKLSYDDFVRKYIPDFPYEEITIRHLL